MTHKSVQKSELLKLANVGPATLEDLHRCGITTVAALKLREPTELYHQLCALTKLRHDPCAWDVFAAAIHEAKTGEKTKWWKWTARRKELALSL